MKRFIAVTGLILLAVCLFFFWLMPRESESSSKNGNLNAAMIGDWTLENVEETAHDSSDTFFVPAQEERENQQIGDSVRLHFVLKNPKSGEPRAERMWVTITRPYGPAGAYKGVLENRPAFIPELHVGDEVEFMPENIARTIIRKGDPRWIDSSEKRALVSEMCFLKGECVRFLYRQEPDNEEDSGWRMFSGHEGDEYANDPKNIRLPEVGWMLDRDSTLLFPLKSGVGAVFERDELTGEWRSVEDWNPED